MLNYKELIQSSQGGEDKMWESVDRVCHLLDELKDTHPEMVRRRSMKPSTASTSTSGLHGRWCR